MKRSISLLALTALLFVAMTSSALAYGSTGHYKRCNSGLYISIHTRTTQNVTAEINRYGQRRDWGNYWGTYTFNTRQSYGYWRAYTTGRMDYVNTYAYCAPY